MSHYSAHVGFLWREPFDGGDHVDDLEAARGGEEECTNDGDPEAPRRRSRDDVSRTQAAEPAGSGRQMVPPRNVVHAIRDPPALPDRGVFQVLISIGTAFLDIGQSSYKKCLTSLFFITVNQGSITSMISVNNMYLLRRK